MKKENNLIIKTRIKKMSNKGIIDSLISELEIIKTTEHPGIYIGRLEKIKERITKEIIKEKIALKQIKDKLTN